MFVFSTFSSMICATMLVVSINEKTAKSVNVIFASFYIHATFLSLRCQSVWLRSKFNAGIISQILLTFHMIKKLLDLARSRGEAVIVDSETGEMFELRPLEDEFDGFLPDFSDFEEVDSEDPFADSAAAWDAPEQSELEAEQDEVPDTEKIAEFSQDFGIPASHAADLTDEDLIAKIDRDIEEWKKQQELAQSAEKSAKNTNPVADLNDLTLTPVQEPAQQAEVQPGEEQFYIEPVE